MRVHYGDSVNRDEPITCDKVEEGEEGLHLIKEKDGPNERIGYIPYKSLRYVEPSDDERLEA